MPTTCSCAKIGAGAPVENRGPGSFPLLLCPFEEAHSQGVGSGVDANGGADLGNPQGRKAAEFSQHGQHVIPEDLGLPVVVAVAGDKAVSGRVVAAGNRYRRVRSTSRAFPFSRLRKIPSGKISPSFKTMMGLTPRAPVTTEATLPMRPPVLR